MPKLTRRDFLSSSATLALAAHPLLAAPAGKSHLLLLGTQTLTGTSKGIYACSFDSITGELSQQTLAATTPNPTFLIVSPNRKTVFAANELETYEGKPGGAVTSFTLDSATGHLAQVSQQPSHGGSPCHISVDPTGRDLFVANYTGGSAGSYHLTKTGGKTSGGDQISPSVSFFQFTGHGPDASRQLAPHAHRVTVAPGNNFLFVNDLGLDQIHIYKLDPATATLTPSEPSHWQAPAGSGPRALLFHPNGKFAYCITEMGSSVLVLAWDDHAGTLTTVQEVPLPVKKSLIPAGSFSTGLDIVLDRGARHAYVANRFDNFLATFTVSPDGSRLTFQRRSSCGGKVPRHFALDPTEHWLLVANQESDTIAVFARDPATGILADTGKTFPVSRPQCILFPLK